MIDKEHPFKIKVLMVYEGINGNNATSRAVRTLKEELENQDVKVVVSESLADAEALISADPTIQCLLLKLDEKSQTCCQHAGEVLEVLRQRNKDMPVFLLSSRTMASEVRQTFLTRLTILSGFWKTPLILSPAEFWPQPNVTASLSCRRCLRLWPSLPRCTSIRGIHPAIPAERLF